METYIPEGWTQADVERFWAKIKVGGPDECWEWVASAAHGYGLFKAAGRNRGSHRIAWEMANGEDPGVLDVCHRCDSPRCCNHAHLFLGTHQQNMDDMAAKGRSRRIGGGVRPGQVVAQTLLDVAGQGFYTLDELCAMFPMGRLSVCRALSGENWKRLRRSYSDYRPAERRLSPEEKDRIRFWSYVRVGGTDECWEWMGAKSWNGYGRVVLSGYRSPRSASRTSLEWSLGRLVADGMMACHTCDNPGCVRPDHLYEGTPSDNSHDMIVRGRIATGDRSGPRLHPERLARGDRNGSRLHPERLKPQRGDDHWTKRRPERKAVGERHGMAVLTEDDVRWIRSQHATGRFSLCELGRQKGVSDGTIRKVVKRKTWSWVT